MDELLSVIVPNYNKEKYIRQCLDSILNQTYTNIEIIVVDDRSTDSSPAIIAEYQERNHQIKPVLLEKNGGVSHARNTGIYVARGKYITTIDSDDFYYNPDKLKQEMTLIKKNGGGIAYSYRHVIREDGSLLYQERRQLNRYVSGNVFFRFLTEKDGFWFVQRDMCMLKQTMVEAGGYDEKESYYEDYDLLLRLASKNRFHYTGEDGTAYRIMNGLASTQRKRDSQQFRVPQQIRLRYIKLLHWSQKVPAYVLWFMESVRLEIRINGRKVLCILRKRDSYECK